jgi:hypothetical protein
VFAVWCVTVFFSIVYLGEHYVVDALAGMVLAGLTWAVMMRVVVPRVGALQHRSVPRVRDAGVGVRAGTPAAAAREPAAGRVLA